MSPTQLLVHRRRRATSPAPIPATWWRIWARRARARLGERRPVGQRCCGATASALQFWVGANALHYRRNPAQRGRPGARAHRAPGTVARAVGAVPALRVRTGRAARRRARQSALRTAGRGAEGGSVRHAAQTLGTSYRYVWDALHKWERALGEPLVNWSQGQACTSDAVCAEAAVGGAARANAHAAAHRGAARRSGARARRRAR